MTSVQQLRLAPAALQRLFVQSYVYRPDGDTLQALEELFACGDEILIELALAELPTRLPQLPLPRTLDTLANYARIAPDPVARAILDALAAALAATNPARLTSLRPGQPLLPLTSIPHLAPHLALALAKLLIDLSPPACSHAADLLQHLSPVLLRLLDPSATSAALLAPELARLATLRPELARLVCRLLALSVTNTAPSSAPSAANLHALGMALVDVAAASEQGSSEATNLASIAIDALLVKTHLKARNGSGEVALATQMAATLLGMLPRDHSVHAALHVAMAHLALKSAHTDTQPRLFRMLSVALKASGASAALAANSQLTALRLTLLHDLASAPTPPARSLVQTLSQQLDDAETGKTAAALSLPPCCAHEPAAAALTCAVMQAHGDAQLARDWLIRLTSAAFAKLPPQRQVRLRVFAAMLLERGNWGRLADALLHDDEIAAPTHGTDSDVELELEISTEVLGHVAALVTHDDEKVAGLAVVAAATAAAASPASAVPLIPSALAALQRCINACLSPSPAATKSRPERVLLPAFLLPAVAHSPHTDGMFLAVVRRLLDAAAQPHAQTLGLRLLWASWALTGRGWQHLSRAVSALAPADARAGGKEVARAVSVRCAAAAVMLDAARCAPERALAFVAPMQACLLDEDDRVASLAMEAICALCDHDAVNTYSAWQVVQASHPKLPQGPLLRQRWLMLLSHGALDAKQHLHQFEAMLDLLWSALSHSDPAVRGTAATALARYPVALQVEHEVARDPGNYVQPLLSATCAKVALSSESLAALALRHEYDHRRALLSSAPAASRAPEAGQLAALRHRATRMMPPKLRGKLSSGWAWLAIELAGLEAGPATPDEVLEALREALSGCDWTAVPERMGGAGVEMAFSTWSRFLTWVLQGMRIPETLLLDTLRSAVDAPAPRQQSNAGLALGGLALCGSLCPVPAHDLLGHLLHALTQPDTSSTAAAGLAIGIAACLDALAVKDDTTAAAATDALLASLAQHAPVDPWSCAAIIQAIAALASGYGARHASTPSQPHALCCRALSLIVFMLSELAPDAQADLDALVQSLPAGWTVTTDDGTDAALAAVRDATKETGAHCVVAAAVTSLAPLLGSGGQATLLPLSTFAMKLAQLEAGSSGTGSASVGARAAAVAVLPRLAQHLLDCDAPAQAQEILGASLQRSVLESAVDAPDLAAAVASLAADLSIRVAGAGEAEAAGELLEESRLLLGDLDGWQTRASSLPRSRTASPVLAVACAPLLGLSPLRGSSLRECGQVPRGPHGLLARSALAEVARDLYKQLEKACFTAPRAEGLKAWVLSLSGKMLPAQATAATHSSVTCRPLSDFPKVGPMTLLATSVLQGVDSLSQTPDLPTLTRCASALAVLGDGPWLPLLDWRPAFERISALPLQCPESVSSQNETSCASEWAAACVRLQLTCVNAAIVHSATPDLGVVAWLADLMQPGAWARAPSHLRLHLLLSLSGILRALPSPAWDATVARAVDEAQSADATYVAAACIGIAHAVSEHCVRADESSQAWSSSADQRKLSGLLLSACVAPAEALSKHEPSAGITHDLLTHGSPSDKGDHVSLVLSHLGSQVSLAHASDAALQGLSTALARDRSLASDIEEGASSRPCLANAQPEAPHELRRRACAAIARAMRCLRAQVGTGVLKDVLARTADADAQQHSTYCLYAWLLGHAARRNSLYGDLLLETLPCLPACVPRRDAQGVRARWWTAAVSACVAVVPTLAPQQQQQALVSATHTLQRAAQSEDADGAAAALCVLAALARALALAADAELSVAHLAQCIPAELHARCMDVAPWTGDVSVPAAALAAASCLPVSMRTILVGIARFDEVRNDVIGALYSAWETLVLQHDRQSVPVLILGRTLIAVHTKLSNQELGSLLPFMLV